MSFRSWLSRSGRGAKLVVGRSGHAGDDRLLVGDRREPLPPAQRPSVTPNSKNRGGVERACNNRAACNTACNNYCNRVVLCCHFATFFWCTHLDPAATCVQVGAHFAPTLRPAPAPPALPPSDGHFSYYPNASLTTDPTAPFDAPTIDRHLRAHNPPRPCRRQLELRNVTRCNGSTHSDESLFGSNPLESNCCPAPSRLVQSWQPVILHREIERPLKKMRLATLVPAFLFFPLAMSQTSSVALTDLLDNVGDAEVPVGIRAVIGPGTTVIPGQSS